MSNNIEVLVAYGLYVPNCFKDVPNFVKDVPNCLYDVHWVPMSVSGWGTISNPLLRVPKGIYEP